MIFLFFWLLPSSLTWHGSCNSRKERRPWAVSNLPPNANRDSSSSSPRPPPPIFMVSEKVPFFFWCPARGWWHPGDTEGLAACPSRSMHRHPRVLPGCSRSPPASILASRLGDGEVAELNTSTNRAARQKGQGTTPWLSCT